MIAGAATLRQVASFATVGVAAAIFHYGVLIALVETGIGGPVLASAAGFVVGGVVSYLLNRRYTFVSPRPHPAAAPRFAVVALAALGLNTAAMWLLADRLAMPYLAAQLVTTALVFVWTFAANRWWTFAAIPAGEPMADPWRLAAAAGLAAALAIVVLTFRDYGVTWDEHYHFANGRHVLAWYTSGLRDTAALTWHNLYLYGGAFDLAVAAAQLVSPLRLHETAHLLNALVGLLGVVGCWRLADALAGNRAALFAAAFLLLTPDWYGLMFNDPKDIPFASAMAWALYLSVRYVQRLPSPPPGLAFGVGVAIGVALGVRVGGVIAVFYLVAGIVAWMLIRRAGDGDWRAARGAFAPLARGALVAAPTAYAVMLLFWPWAQVDPLRNPLRALALFSRIEWDLDVLFAGGLVNSMHLPATYLPVQFAVKLAEPVLALLATGVALVAIRAFAGPGGRGSPLRADVAMTVVAAAFPFAYFVAARPVTYDAIRHFLFVLPPLCVCAGLVADRLAAAVGSRGRLAATAAGGLAVAWVGTHVALMARLHPDEYVFHNRLAGGVKGAEGRFELDYWGNSYHEAVDRLVARLRAETPGREPPTYRVAVCSSGLSASAFFPPFLRWTGVTEETDFYLSSTRLGCDGAMEGEEFVVVRREGAVLSLVKDRRRLRTTDPERFLMAKPADRRVHPGTTLGSDAPAPR